MARGLSNAEIAGELVLERGDVKTHVKRILAKLGGGTGCRWWCWPTSPAWSRRATRRGPGLALSLRESARQAVRRALPLAGSGRGRLTARDGCRDAGFVGARLFGACACATDAATLLSSRPPVPSARAVVAQARIGRLPAAAGRIRRRRRRWCSRSARDSSASRPTRRPRSRSGLRPSGPRLGPLSSSGRLRGPPSIASTSTTAVAASARSADRARTQCAQELLS